MKRKISLGTKLYALLGAFALVLVAYGGFLLWERLILKGQIEALLRSNEVSDELIVATSQFAVERGLTNLALSEETPPQEMKSKILQRREMADKAYGHAMETVEAMQRAKDVPEWLTPELEKMFGARKELESARTSVDNFFRSGRKDIESKQWVEIVTRFIDLQTFVRMGLQNPHTTSELALKTNVYLKHLLWQAAEFAGRERATIAGHIAHQKPIAPDTMNNLNIWRATVERSLNEAMSLVNSYEGDEHFAAALKNMENEFYGTFEKVRKVVYANASTGKYPLTGDAWVSAATDGIDSILKSSAQASEELDERLDAEVFRTKRDVWVSIGILILSFLLIGFSAVHFHKSVIAALNQIIDDLSADAVRMGETSRTIAAQSEELSMATSQQASAIAETAASAEELTSMIKRNTQNAEKTNELATASKMAADQGSEMVRNVNHSMTSINDSYSTIMSQVEQSNLEVSEIVKVISQIGEKTKVINEIVFQTKLLSFNASVEAARAGEHGKGFAVVAEEVGNLAQMSGNAAREISSMLDESITRVNGIVNRMKTSIEGLIVSGKKKVEDGGSLAKACGDSLENIVTNISTTNQMSEEITSASREQARGVEEITKAMNQLDHVTQQNSTTAVEAAKAAEDLSAQAQRMGEIVRALVSAVKGEGDVLANSVREKKEASTVLEFPSQRQEAPPARAKAVANGRSRSTIPLEDDHRFQKD